MKKAPALALISAVSLALAGCASNSGGNPQKESSPKSFSTDHHPVDGGSWTQELSNGGTVDCVWTAQNNQSGGLDCLDVTYKPSMVTPTNITSAPDGSFDVEKLPVDGGSWTQALPDGGSIQCVWTAQNNKSGGLDCIEASYTPAPAR